MYFDNTSGDANYMKIIGAKYAYCGFIYNILRLL